MCIRDRSFVIPDADYLPGGKYSLQIGTDTSDWSNAVSITVLTQIIAPTITSISSSTISAGSILSIKGSGFGVEGVSKVTLLDTVGGSRAKTYNFGSPYVVGDGKEILFAVPTTTDVLPAGDYLLRVYKSLGGWSNSVNLKVTSDPQNSELKDNSLVSTTPSISITSPIKGETWAAGSTHRISWAANVPGNTAPKFDIIQIPYPLPADADPEDYQLGIGGWGRTGTYYDWAVTGVSGYSKYLLKVCISGTAICDTTKVPFTVTYGKQNNVPANKIDNRFDSSFNGRNIYPASVLDAIAPIVDMFRMIFGR